MDEFKGKDMKAVLARLGSPNSKRRGVFDNTGYGPHRSLGAWLKPGQAYERWDYEDGGDTHMLFFSDPSVPQKARAAWQVIYVTIHEEGTVY